MDLTRPAEPELVIRSRVLFCSAHVDEVREAQTDVMVVVVGVDHREVLVGEMQRLAREVVGSEDVARQVLRVAVLEKDAA